MKNIHTFFSSFFIVFGLSAVLAVEPDLFYGLESASSSSETKSSFSAYSVHEQLFNFKAAAPSQSKTPASSTVVRINMPDVEKQDDSWSCGINSGTRMLKHYGVDISYDEFRKIRQKAGGTDGGVRPSFLFTVASPILALASTQRFRLGTQPKELVTLLNAQFQKHGKSKRAMMKTEANLSDIKAMLRKNKPLVALIEPAKHALHWIVIAGFNEKEETIYYYETNGANVHYKYSNATFKKKWLDWEGYFDRLPLVGLKEGVFVYVD